MKSLILSQLNCIARYNIMRLIFILVTFLLLTLAEPRRRAGFLMPRPRRFRTFSNIGRNLFNFWKYGVYQDDATKSGKQMQASVNKIKLHEQMLEEQGSYLSLILLSLTGVTAIICYLRYSKQQEDLDIDYDRIRQRREHRQRRNRVLQAIDLHGVHPDRATGDIYRIRL